MEPILLQSKDIVVKSHLLPFHLMASNLFPHLWMVLYEFGMLLFKGILLLTKDIPMKYLQSSSLRMGPEWLQSQRIPYAYGRP